MKRLSWGPRSIPACTLVLALALLAGGCAGRSGSLAVPDAVVPPACVASPEAPRSFDRSVVIALTEPVTAENAPLPANEGERAVFAQLYETLVTLDCTGRVRPGLARSWSVSGDGREWTFHLRENARFSNGAPLLAENVRVAWERVTMRYLMNQRLPVPESPWTWVSPESVRSIGDDVVIVSLTEPVGDTPALFAHPALSVIKRSSYLGWPLGSGPYLLSMADTRTITLIPNRFAPDDLRGRADLVFQVRPGADPRDVLAEKPDALLLRSASGLGYARRLPDYRRSLAGGERTYYLLTENLEEGALAPAALDPFRKNLAGDVVLSDAHPVVPGAIVLPSQVWVARPTRPGLGGAVEGAVLACSRDDAEAERIAERVMVWASRPEVRADAETGAAVKVHPLDGETFRHLLERGSGWGFILSLRSSDPLFSREEQVFFDNLPWFLKPRLPIHGGILERREREPAAVPLVTTVAHLVLRDGLCGVAADGTGTFSFRGAGWSGDADASGEGAAP